MAKFISLRLCKTASARPQLRVYMQGIKPLPSLITGPKKESAAKKQKRMGPGAR